MNNNKQAFILGVLLAFGLSILGFTISNSIVKIKILDRTVTVKGLAEKEVAANTAIWPIRFNIADNDLTNLYLSINNNSKEVINFLENNGFEKSEISTSQPAIIDRQAEGYYEADRYKYRYTANVIITVYTDKIDNVLSTMDKLIELGKRGIVIAAEQYDSRTEYIFTGLNDIKPGMIEEATKNGREVANKFAQDSNSKLGKIKKAYQGQFSIQNRDGNTPYIKKVRVVSTLEYYLID
jgi:hypothetical protein